MEPVAIGQWYKWKNSSKIGEVVSVRDMEVVLRYHGKEWPVSFYTLKLDWERIQKPRNSILKGK